MPKINRIRIANVSYDGKFIPDQTLEMPGGVNALLNLANGSGKSVLVQMMLQPIIPCKKIHNRRIEDYLSKTSAPTYIMLEWLLDHTTKPQYFLTGIAMCSIGQGEDERSKAKYFTFTHKYDTATEYDIAHTPLIKHVSGRYQYMNYDEALKLMGSVKDELRPLNRFAKDKSKEYEKTLRDHGIYKEEWELLQRINDNEGGVDELFADCKTSDAVLNKWILKAVSDKMGQGNQDLREMFYALIMSVISEEETIAQREVLTAFVADTDKLLKYLTDLCDSLDDISRIEEQLSGLYTYLSMQMEEIETESQNCRNKEKKLKEDEQHIRYEKISESCHRADEDYIACQEKLDLLSETVANLDVLYQTARRIREIMEAAEHQGKIDSAQKRILALREQLDKLKDWTLEQETQDITFTLYAYYTEHIKQSQEIVTVADNTINSLDEDKRRFNEEQKTISREQQKKSTQKGAIETNICQFEVYEQNSNKELGVSVHRTLTHELDKAEVEQTKLHLSEQLNRFTAQQGKLKQVLKEKQERCDVLKSRQTDLQDKRSNAFEHVKSQERELAEYNVTEESYFKITERNGLTTVISEIEQHKLALNEKETQLQSEQARFEEELVRKKDILARLKDGSLHTSTEFGKLLKSNNIPAITGEAFLKSAEMTAESQKRILSKNPMLPFSFLVAENDFDRAISLSVKDGIDRICPVVILESAEKEVYAGKFSSFLPEGGRAMCYYFEESFAPDTKDSFQFNLEQEVESLREKRDIWQKDIDQTRQDITFLRDFTYTSESRRTLTEELNRLKAEYQRLIDIIESEKQEAEDLGNLCEQLRIQINENEKAAEQAENHINHFEEYLEKDSEYVANLSQHRRLVESLHELQRHSNALSAKIDECDSGKNEAILNKTKAKSNLNDFTKKRNDIVAPHTGKLLSWPLDELEARYNQIKQKQSQDEANIKKDIQMHINSIDTAKNALKKHKHLPEDEISSVVFDEDKLELLEKNERERQAAWRDASEKREYAKEEFTRADSEKKSCYKRLREDNFQAPLPPQEIKRDYEARSATIAKELTNLETQKSLLEKEREKCLKDSSRILSIIPQPNRLEIQPPEDGWASIDINEQAKFFKAKNDEVVSLRDVAINTERKLKSDYKGRDDAISAVLGMLSLADCKTSYTDFYYVYERLSNQMGIISETIRVLTTGLEQLDDQKANVVDQAFLHGKMLHRELKALTESSHVKLAANRLRLQTLDIDIPNELEDSAREHIVNHVEECILAMRGIQKEEGVTEKRMREMVASRLSDREIINRIIGRHTLTVRLLKVDVSQINTKLRSWESVIKDNSGGELFISCFMLFTALMDYSRKHVNLDDKSDGGAKVMVIDNPFGAASSEHLVDALVQVAKQFNIQLICLSDLSQSSITSKFALIHQLSIRPALHSGKSYLKIDNTVENEPISRDSRLEHVSLRYEQTNLFG